MKIYEYLSNLEKKLKNNFDIKRDLEINNEKLDMYAYCNINNCKYMGSKNLKIWSYEINEHCLIKSFEDIDEEIFSEFINWLKESMSQLVKPHPEHMQTYLTGVLVVENGISQNIINFIEKFKYSKSFFLGFQGWCDLRLVLVDLTGQKIYANKKGEEVKTVYLLESA